MTGPAYQTTSLPMWNASKPNATDPITGLPVYVNAQVTNHVQVSNGSMQDAAVRGADLHARSARRPGLRVQQVR